MFLIAKCILTDPKQNSSFLESTVEGDGSTFRMPFTMEVGREYFIEAHPVPKEVSEASKFMDGEK